MTKQEMVRLNVEVPKDLWRRAKQRALDTDKDLRTVVIELLERGLKPRTSSGYSKDHSVRQLNPEEAKAMQARKESKR